MKKSRNLSSEGDTQEKSILKLSDEHIAHIGENVKTTIETQFSSLVTRIITSVLSGIQEKLSSLEHTNKEFRQQVNELKRKVTGLERKVEILLTENENSNQHSKRNCLRLSGVKESVCESTDEIVMDIISVVCSNVHPEQVNCTDRLGPQRKPEAASSSRSNRPKDIIRKFVSFRARQSLYKFRTRLKDNGYKGIFLNEEFTRSLLPSTPSDQKQDRRGHLDKRRCYSSSSGPKENPKNLEQKRL